MKRLVISCLGLVLGFTAMAQIDSTANKDELTVTKEVEIKVGGETMVFNAEASNNSDLAGMIMKVMGQMIQIQAQNEKALEEINKQEAAGEITAKEAEERKEAIVERTEESVEALENIVETWGDDFEERMEAWAEEYEASMEAWEEAAEAAAENGQPIPPMPPVPAIPIAPNAPTKTKTPTQPNRKVIIDEDGVRVENDTTETDGPVEFRIKEKNTEEEEGIDWEGLEQKSTQKVDRTESYFDIHFGFNQNLEEGQYLIEDVPGEQDFWKSTSFNLGYGGKSRLGNPYSKLYIKYGIDFSWHNFRLNNNQVLDHNNRNAFFREIDSVSFDKTKYHTAYFNIPLMFQLDFSDVGERDEKLTLGLGGYGGVRINAKRELEYSSNLYDEVEEKTKHDFYTSRIRYGVMAQVGYGSFKVTASYDLNPFFREGKGPSTFRYNMVNVTLGFTL